MDDEDMRIWDEWIKNANKKIENYEKIMEEEEEQEILEEREVEVIAYLSPIKWFMERAKKNKKISEYVEKIMVMEDVNVDRNLIPIMHLYLRSLITIHRYELLNLMRIEKMINEEKGEEGRHRDR